MSGPLFRDYDEECDALMYEGGVCGCDLIVHRDDYAMPVHGEDADPYDGRLGGIPLDW